MQIREWALKCSIVLSMLYDQLAKDVYAELYGQFYKHQNPRIWTTSISGMFDLLHRYGFGFFEDDTVSTGDSGESEKPKAKSKKSSRQLYNTMEYLEPEDDDGTVAPRRNG